MKKVEIKKNYSFKRASEISVPDEFFNPIKTGIRDVDESWSEIGGIVPSQVTFITGNPGAGKTTLCLAVGATLASEVKIPIEDYIAAGINVAFISLEMSEFQLAHQAKKIPGFSKVHVTGDFDQEETMKMIRQLKPGLIILDSIQKAARKMKDENGKPMAFNTAQYVITDMFTQYAKETWCPVMLIGHCDKSGNYKGPSDLLHDVDSHLHVHYDKEMDLRTFSFGKNRFGGVMQDSLFGITSQTVWIGSPYITRAYADAAITKKDPSAKPAPLEKLDGSSVSVCLKALENKWDGGTARATINSIVNFLKANDEDFSANSKIKIPQKVKIDFRGNTIAHCHPASGELVFGKKTFTDTLEIGKVGYKKEQKHINLRVTTKVELLVWVIINNWCRLYNDKEGNNEEVFTFIGEKYDWFMAEIQPHLDATV